ncbi:hypothetical protein IAI09_09730 [Lysinibacillus fusiformis]|nr:hypothetical protein [Lysinibacillus fusiformis]
MLDDYLHLVDTVRWLCDGDLSVQYGNIHTNGENQLLYAQHTYESPRNITFTTAMHRKAGSNWNK